MKKILNILLATSLIVTLFSCGNDEEPIPAVDLKLSNNTVSLNLNAESPTATVTIESGNGGYDVKSADETIATASLSGTTITINAVATGSTSVTVTDNANKTATISVTVSYNTPNTAKFNWNGQDIEFDKVGGYGISILSNGVALTDLVSDKKQYLLSWTGGLSEGDKSDGKLVIAEQGKDAETINLSSLKVVQAGTAGNYILFGDTNRSGELFFNN